MKASGITDSTASANWAVFSRPAGEFADAISGSDHEHARWAYLHNEFGTPFVPISSASLSNDEMLFPSSSTRAAVTEIVSPSRRLASGQQLSDLAKKGGASLTRAQLASRLTGSR